MDKVLPVVVLVTVLLQDKVIAFLPHQVEQALQEILVQEIVSSI